MKNIDRQTLATQIRQRRKENGVTTYKVAELLGLPQPRIAELEAGKTKNIDTWLAAIEALGGRVKIEWS